ncbi:MAG: cytochrome C oxidase subunit IV family protein [Ignavibacteriae bacterium]|nr:cytochrome C oxidase subunit IV family protein [Ignavibacteriota bacterium]MCB9242200.1 cytochrome C oxidase subunit IV family protein [Ignavibacteriales bacterium]
MDEKTFERDVQHNLGVQEQGPEDAHEEGHDVGYGTFVLIWLALIGLTAITVTIAGINLGSLALVVAIIIAMTKTSLVMNYFMHVKFDSTIFRIFILVCIIIFLTMILLTFTDLIYRNPLL